MQIRWFVYLIDLAAATLLGYCIFQIKIRRPIDTDRPTFYIRYYVPRNEKPNDSRIYVFEPTSILEANKKKKFYTNHLNY